MHEYLVRKASKSTNNIRFKELVLLVKCIQKSVTITIDYTNVKDKLSGEYLKNMDYKVLFINGQVLLEKKKHGYKILDSLYKKDMVNAYLKDINFKVEVVGKEQQLKIM